LCNGEQEKVVKKQRQKIQSKIIKNIKKIAKLQEEIYWLARKRDKLDATRRLQAIDR